MNWICIYLQGLANLSVIENSLTSIDSKNMSFVKTLNLIIFTPLISDIRYLVEFRVHFWFLFLVYLGEDCWSHHIFLQLQIFVYIRKLLSTLNLVSVSVWRVASVLIFLCNNCSLRNSATIHFLSWIVIIKSQVLWKNQICFNQSFDITFAWARSSCWQGI